MALAIKVNGGTHRVSASALLASNPRPAVSCIDAARSRNIRRCRIYLGIGEATKRAAQ
jgi:aerobic-type carbon monoxide dehydrogenase small subunit (CoxS/CutS family)